MIKITSLGSGSKGNCVLISNGTNRLLIDAGLSISAIYKKLKNVGLTLNDIDGILLTHEHDDHIKSVEALSAYIPVYSHPATLEYVADKYAIPLKQQMEVEEQYFNIGTFDILPFRTSHDALHPYGFVINDSDSKLSYITDTGYISKGIMEAVKGSDIVMIESNHDEELLLLGVYPDFLKRRIMSERGHLSNAECALTISTLMECGATKFMLAHLSENNNLPELAYWTTTNYLARKGIDCRDYTLRIANQKETVFLE
ncbi:MAG TPA: MBL fold metallo-hydrolase [Clostridia bacterium]|jgi:phosphoribosyl 1,2-cyclic phosphodiesterase|nr:MBL fold metallo-hydrolase [Clostridia bacterium]